MRSGDIRVDTDAELVTDVTTTQHNLDGLRTLLTAGPVGFDNLWDSTDVDPIPGYPADPVGGAKRWIRIGFKVNPGYNPPRVTGEVAAARRPVHPPARLARPRR